MRKILCALSLLVAGSASSLFGQATLAFNPLNNGNGSRSSFAGSLGLVFTLSGGSLNVASLGYWDDGLDGVAGGSSISVAIYDANSGLQVPGAELTFSGTIGSLEGQVVNGGQFRLMDLVAPVTLLSGGTYELVAWTYDSLNLYLNGGNPPEGGAVATANSFGGAFGGTLNFVESRFDNSPATMPTAADSDQSYIKYASATFSPDSVPIPEPATTTLQAGIVALLAGVLIQRRRLRLLA